MTTNLRYYMAQDNPMGGSGEGKDYPPRKMEQDAVKRNADHPGSSANAAGVNNEDKGEGHKGANTPLVNIERGGGDEGTLESGER